MRWKMISYEFRLGTLFKNPLNPNIPLPLPPSKSKLKIQKYKKQINFYQIPHCAIQRAYKTPFPTAQT